MAEKLNQDFEIEPILTPVERINAQREIVGLMNIETEEERVRVFEENSGPFRELEKDPAFRRLVRKGDFEEAIQRLKAFKQEQKAGEAA